MGGSYVTGNLQSALPYAAQSCADESAHFGLWYQIVGSGIGITATTCVEETDFDTQISVYTGSCDALQCLVGNDDVGAVSTLGLGFWKETEKV